MHYLKIFLILITLLNTYFAQKSVAGEFGITRIKYGGGGDWYSDPSSIPNLLKFIKSNTKIAVNLEENRAQIGDDEFYLYSYLYLTGHGNINITEKEAQILRNFLIEGGFLHADDNYGMNESFRREMKKVFPDKEWVELPLNHDIFNTFYIFKNGLPKIHEHDNKRPQAFALFHDNRIIAIYTYESDLGDGWENKNVHDVPQAKRNQALRMGTNIIFYALTRL